MSESIFTSQQRTVLDALANGATITEAAAFAGVHRNTIGNWRRETINFEIALAAAHYDKALAFRERAEAMADLAFDAIRAILADPKASPSVRLKAALTIVNLINTQIGPQKPVKINTAEAMLAPIPEPPPEPATVHNSAQSGRIQTIRHAHPIPGRNDSCPCGSGQKYKRCCLNKPAANPELARAA